MKMRLLATTVAVMQLTTVTLPAAAAWADDQGRGGGHERGGEGRGQGQGPGGGHGPGQARPAEQRHAPAQRHDQYRGADQRRDYGQPYMGGAHGQGFDSRHWDRGSYGGYQNHGYWQPYLPYRHGPHYYVPLGRSRYYRDIFIARPYGHWYTGYGYYYHDNDAFAFLAFTAIALAILDIMSQSQQRALENAQIRATGAPIGAPIYWNEGNASGAVTALRDGTDSNGHYCREFEQQVTIGSRRETAYGTACRRDDGVWQIVETQ